MRTCLTVLLASALCRLHSHLPSEAARVAMVCAGDSETAKKLRKQLEKQADSQFDSDSAASCPVRLEALEFAHLYCLRPEVRRSPCERAALAGKPYLPCAMYHRFRGIATSANGGKRIPQSSFVMRKSRLDGVK